MNSIPQAHGEESMKLYAHPFSSYCQKVLVALYENATSFEYRNLEDASASAELESLWPLKRFPVLVDGGHTILESSTIIEHLQIHHAGTTRLIPEGDAGVAVRMLDRIFDNYVMTPMQKVVLDQLRPEAGRDAYGVTEARGQLDRIYAWLDRRVTGHAWAAGSAFTLADCAAAPRCSMRTGPMRFRPLAPICAPTAPASWRTHPSPAP
jgi:glutathione S-transferase